MPLYVSEKKCQAITKSDKPCPITPEDWFDYCHVHEPSLQFGAERKDGTRCNMATGGVRCKYHPKPKFADFKS